MTDQAAYWRNLKQQAVAGSFRMEEGLGEALRAACEQYVTALQDLKFGTKEVAHLSGWGGLETALILKAKYEAKAITGSGDDPNDSADKRLATHIEIAELMRDTFAAAIGKLQSVDGQNAGDLTATGQAI
ncbi:hypothetical protein FEK33_00825 [Nocardia asteroides NBRC 15531]|uniref:Uncharacterized protein n=1 Tax=Nocardia asteroides NBRC 15531 TaxID=1110697 RepID=U5E593_NOCAS|nr:hypothetical protein [Nocardia asteroides]TLF68922.1 hypothetical protein FEK33_00825 [Nocardia asteroides NBRC 15531]UGT48389.1 hypothetical protein LT345_28650 [Nocardia asteroides]SFL57968.1 hypothetical protein SAMN05444423_101166 [Nocardia asteroides]VEG32373.1 Uncharacterised protein [Nocardia asteroides]GAD84887.1 hypothetical protein NCAST_25_03100 [Nocardia asteroides NBRC 15531]